MSRKINYYSRSFSEIRTELVNFVKQYYPDVYKDFNDASIGMMLLELNAAVGDMLSFNTDRVFQETQIDYAQERKSVLSLARTFGLKIPNLRPSIALVNFEVIVPVDGDGPDMDYAPILKIGSQVKGGGQTFETMEDIDFSSRFSSGRIPNWQEIPQYNNNNIISAYKLIKQELVVNGVSKIYKQIITPDNVRPFFEVVLPETNVLSIESVLLLEGNVDANQINPDEFYSPENRWFEVDTLAEDKVFTQTGTSDGMAIGNYMPVEKRFMTEYTDNGFIKLIFGSGTQDLSALNDYNINPAYINNMGDIINNLALGTTLKPNTTLLIKYRVGGGSNTNLGPNTITDLGLVDIRVNGLDNQKNLAVERSLSIDASSLAIGGRDKPSVEEIRKMIKYNFSSQNRAVTLKDYLVLLKKIPSKFGVPYRVGVSEEKNKIKISTLGLDSNGKLVDDGNSVLNHNITNFLSDYKMLNDYVYVQNGYVINLGIEVDVLIGKDRSRGEVMNQILTEIRDYMDINNFEMGENLYLTPLVKKISDISGVINIIDLRVYDKSAPVGYSSTAISQKYVDDTTKQIDISDVYTVFGEPDTMFEVKYPDRDIKVRVKNI